MYNTVDEIREYMLDELQEQLARYLRGDENNYSYIFMLCNDMGFTAPEKAYYSVSFRWYDTDTFCTNIAHAASRDAVERYYADKYGPDVIVNDAPEWAVRDARERRKPIVEIQ